MSAELEETKMDAKSLKISKVFASGGDVHYILPHFQREYAWEKENWQTLLNDVMGLYIRVIFLNINRDLFSQE